MHRTLSTIIVLTLLGVGVLGVMYFASQNKRGFNFASKEGTSEIADTNTSDTSLEGDLAEIELEDPAVDFTSVDSDINSL